MPTQYALPKMIAFDLDGTLLQARDSSLSAGHSRCIAAIRARGIMVVLVTGRPLISTAPTWHDLHLDSYIVCFNGTWVGTPNGQALTKTALSQDDVRDIITCLQDFPGAISAYPSVHTWAMSKRTVITENWSRIYGADIDFNPALFENWHGDSQKVLYAGDAQTIPFVLSAVRKRFGDRFHIVQSQNDRFEIHRCADKAWGLAALAQHLNIAQADIWAVGDAHNDLEMLRWAGRSFAMGNAPDCVRNAATHLLPSVAARGICGLMPFLDRCPASE